MLFTLLQASVHNPASSAASADRTLFAAASSPIKKMSQKINGKTVTYLMINMNDSRLTTKLATANGKINQAALGRNINNCINFILKENNKHL